MRKLGKVALWTLFFVLMPVVAMAQEHAGGGGDSSWGYALGAGLAIGLTLTLIHLIGIPITNTSVNPARSTGPAIFVGGWAISQLWLFWVAPLVGGALGGLAYRLFDRDESD